MNYEENNKYVHDYEDDGRPIPSTKIGYNNTDSGLEATTVQGAIDEVAQILDTKQDKAYDGSESGIEADTVTGAIDELAQGVSDLTDVAESLTRQLNEKLLFVGYNDISIAIENKTFQDLFENNELYTLIGNQISALDDGTYVEIKYITIAPSLSGYIFKLSNNALYNKTDTLSAHYYYAISYNATNSRLYIDTMRIASTSSKLVRKGFETTGNLVTNDMTSDTTTSVTNVNLRIAVYKKVTA